MPTPVSTVVHLLLQADPGAAPALAERVSALPQVRSAELTSGAYDVIAQVEVTGEQDLDSVLGIVRDSSGLARVCVCRHGAA